MSMLAKNDIKQIGEIVDQRLDQKLDEKFGEFAISIKTCSGKYRIILKKLDKILAVLNKMLEI